MTSLARVALAAALAVTPRGDRRAPPAGSALDGVAMGYVKLVLAIGQHRPDYADAYFGPKELKAELAGLDPSEAGRYAEIRRLLEELQEAAIETARAYLGGDMTAAEVEAWWVRHGLQTPEQAKERVEFLDAYWSYVVNYSYGEALVGRHVERAGKDPARRWAAFVELNSTPAVPRVLGSEANAP